MASKHYDKAIKAINEVFGDTEVSKQETIESLHALEEEIGSMIGALLIDLQNEENKNG